MTLAQALTVTHEAAGNEQVAVDPLEVGLGSGALIVTPTFNERDNLREFVLATLNTAPGAHLLVVDDASPDGTGELADELAAEDHRVHVLHRTAKRGLGTAYVEGFGWGVARGYTHFFEMDADLSHDPLHLPAFFDAFARGADVVVGSRNIPGGRVEGWGPGRHLLSKGGSLYSRVILGVDVSDLTTGYKAYTQRAIEAIKLSSVRSNGYSFQVETTYRAILAGLDVREVPIVFVDRRAGHSKMSRRIFAEAVWMVAKLRWRGSTGQL
ncbi:MAG TPA: polyprenol monophosphomannose synthase [Polyangiaceae bacterium]|nr:polyprenol monophosphomannose synthase [Polyangiaceae bacterium]